MLFVDKNDRLWVALKTGGLLRYETDRQNYKNFTHDDEGRPLDAVYAMSRETDSLFWLGTKTQGLCKAVMTPDGKLHITLYAYDPNDPYSLSNNKVHTVLLDSRDRLLDRNVRRRHLSWPSATATDCVSSRSETFSATGYPNHAARFDRSAKLRTAASGQPPRMAY